MMGNRSLPSRERGLKLRIKHTKTGMFKVAPFAGARIEMLNMRRDCLNRLVAPFAGARIEIFLRDWIGDAYESLPSRERGLKSTLREKK